MAEPNRLPDRHAAGWLDVATSDADDAARIQRQWMPMQYDQLDGGAFAGRFRMLRTDHTLVVTELQNRTVLKQQHSPTDYCTISLIRKVSGRGRCGLDTLSGQSVGYMPGGRDYEVQLPPSEILYFGFDQRRLMQAAEVLGYDMPANGNRPVFLDGLDAAGLNRMADTLMALRDRAAADPTATVNRQYLDDVVLERALEILVRAPSGATPVHVINMHRITQHARALIDSSPNEPWTVMTLCQALHVSRATLQRAFQRHYGMSPLAYLRIRRLNGARRALQAGRGTSATVSSVAMHWGFFHLSRFAQDYCQLFGELPSTTLGTQWPAASTAPIPVSERSS
ncbi:transcriptional regulator EutR [compost metagenome]|jgi:AraC family ethanolamine operon transcriptional activator|uniref:Helix-turn-helix domain-containing protein n=1 Tax=Cupriavidus campinensis TaxID=151783 RepID=A0AAE9I2F8_9BURK|nr:MULTISPECIES: helix-turn-helix domain-containing protein [Cupriavidus]TSP14602.1 helix-turn-helix domain-containing protein [Cupriavidus campinensis]URF05300.1 helix-turn-helix domain-containing protein [Cupriavidus campinensis]CAG2137465.1 hypothetical protein LMG19282_01339 [Cupriavidus campinensis]